MVSEYIRPKEEPIAIVGSGCRLPGNATSPSKLWDLLRTPRELSKRVPSNRFNIDGFYHPDPEYPGTTNTKSAYWMEEDPHTFDASFFNITPLEAEAIDPQHRMLLEVTYEALESAGLSIQKMQGSSTSVYVGSVACDYGDIVMRDPVTLSQYTATGTHRSILSNRLSYFYDWRGPSMTIDTACSSSLVAVHHAVRSLRSNESRVACAAGVNLILGPELFITESALHMLSPEGRCRMWDAGANGYARGEGIAVVLLKRLSDALADGDHIEAIIRDSALNQDGRTKGITMPSAEAQARLIQETYSRSGLDPTTSWGRCQYFEAHGTGTQVGDVREAEAIASAFFPSQTAESNNGDRFKLQVGSVKTVIGHTEGTSGLASLLKVALAVQHRVIPPNLHLETLNPDIAPYYINLNVPTTAQPWPPVDLGQPLRASVNSFGFGGTNAHVIVEGYQPEIHGPASAGDAAQTGEQGCDLATLPFVFSAHSQTALFAIVARFHSVLRTSKSVDLHHLAWTLACRRSSHPFRAIFTGSTRSDLLAAMDASLKKVVQDPSADLGIRLTTSARRPRILGIFTGQGAQWATMGKELILRCAIFRDAIEKLDGYLQLLEDGPDWSLKEELLKPQATSRIAEGPISQPLSSAIQMALVDLLKALGVRFHTVIGHSSGELAAAYAAGYIRPQDAMRISYYRGVSTKFAGGRDGKRGTMLAAGLGAAEARVFINRPSLKGRIVIGTSNSPVSVTLSGDLDAVEEARAMLEAEGKFARILKVDNAYHSFHMQACAEPFLASMVGAKIEILTPAEPCEWISSVYGPDRTPTMDELAGPYWRDNMLRSVLFCEGLERAINGSAFDVALEIGPHPALKASVGQTFKGKTGNGDGIPYSGVLRRGEDDVASFSQALGFLWQHLGPEVVDFDRYAASLRREPPRLLKGLPSYPWNHETAFWRESRSSKRYLTRSTPHELLGNRCYTDSSDTTLRWRNVLTSKQLPWLESVRVQGTVTLPASIYCLMVIEAVIASPWGHQCRIVNLHDVRFSHHVRLGDAGEGADLTITVVLPSSNDDDQDSAAFSIIAANDGIEVCKGNVTISMLDDNQASPPSFAGQAYTQRVDKSQIYNWLEHSGLQYDGPFCGLLSATRCLDQSSTQFVNSFPESFTPLLVNPSVLECAVQSALLAFAAPGDQDLWTAFLPKQIERITIHTPSLPRGSDTILTAHGQVTETLPADAERLSPNFTADVRIWNETGQPCIDIEGLTLAPEGTPGQDRRLYVQETWDYDLQYGVAVPGEGLSYQQISGRVLRQFVHCRPQMHVLEICPGFASLMLDPSNRQILSSLASYTVGDTESPWSRQTQTPGEYQIQQLELGHQQLDPEEWQQHSFDIIVIQPTLYYPQHYDQLAGYLGGLVRAGGYVICPSAPAWQDSDRLLQTAWSERVQCAGFSPINSDAAVMVFQQGNRGTSGLVAGGYQIRHETSYAQGQLMVVGGMQSKASAFVQKVTAMLSGPNVNLVQVPSFQDVDLLAVCNIAGVLVLEDIEAPIFTQPSEEKLAIVKAVLSQSPATLWLTSGLCAGNPYHAASLGLGRTLQSQIPQLRLQFLDIYILDGMHTTITEIFCRLLASNSADQPGSFESELMLKDGKVLVSRLRPNRELNDRFETYRRPVQRAVDLAEQPIQLQSTGPGLAYEAIQISPKKTDLSPHDLALTVRVSCATQFGITMADTTDSFFHFAIGADVSTGTHFITLQDSIASIAKVPYPLTCPIQARGLSYDRYLSLSVRCFVAQMVANRCGGDVTTIYDPQEILGGLLQDIYTDPRQRLVCLTHGPTGFRQGAQWIHISPRAMVSEIRAATPRDTAYFVDLSCQAGLATRLPKSLPRRCRYLSAADFICVNPEPTSSSKDRWSKFESSLQAAVRHVESLAEDRRGPPSTLIELQDLLGRKAPQAGDPFSIVNLDCKAPVVIYDRPIDPTDFLSSQGTYLLASIPPALEYSICMWMVSIGARNFILLHRNSVEGDCGWVKEAARSGVRIDVVGIPTLSCKHQVIKSLYAVTGAQRPPIEGVIYGPALEEESVENQMAAINIINDVFSHPTLAFFVALSSASRIAGSSSPSTEPTTVVNMYMAGLCRQRKAKGLPSSVLDLSPIVGIEQPSDQRDLGDISERDFHRSLAEAIHLARDSSNPLNVDVIVGLELARNTEYLPARFGHLLTAAQELDEDDEKTEKVSLVQDVLSPEKTERQAIDRLCPVLTEYLAGLLRLSAKAIARDTVILDLGVDSLVAMDIRAWFSKEMQVDIPVLKILAGASVEELCQYAVAELRSASEQAPSSTVSSPNRGQSRGDILTPTTDDDEVDLAFPKSTVEPMSFGQTTIWLPYVSLENKTAYNCTTTYQLRGHLDINRFELALHAVIRRNSSLRTTFFTDETSGEVFQRVEASSPFQLRQVAAPPFESAAAEIEAEKKLVADHEYDLERGDSFIATLLIHGDSPATVHTIIFGYHHIIMDGVSWQLYLQDLHRCYSALDLDAVPPVGQYVNFAAHQRRSLDSPTTREHRQYWKQEFADLPQPLPNLPFAKRSTRKSLNRYDNIELMVDLPSDLVRRIKNFTTAARVTPFHFYLSVLQVLLHRLSETNDFCIGIVDANRTEAAFADAIGFLIDMLPLRFQLSSDQSFSDLLTATRSKAYAAMGHAGVPLDVILKDINAPSLSVCPPLFQVVLNYRLGVLGQKTIGDVALDWSTYEDANHPFDFILTVDENDGEGFLTLSVQEYLFDRTAGDSLLSTYIHLLETFVSHAALEIGAGELFSPRQIEASTALGKGPVASFGWADTLSLQIDSFVATQPQAMAIKDPSGTLTYQGMSDRIDQIAHALLSAGAQVGTHVGMLCNPSSDAICSLLAIMRIGAVYIPLDVRNSTERLMTIVSESQAGFIVCHRDTVHRLPELQLDGKVQPVDITEIHTPAHPIPNASTADGRAFIMFTSGTTGKPKGVMLRHSSFLNHVAAASRAMSLRRSREVVLQQSAYGYDASLAQIFYALANGGSLVVSSNRIDMADLAQLMYEENITFVLGAPSEYCVLFQYGREWLEKCTDWRIAMCGGEAFANHLRQSFQDLRNPLLQVFNAYGPSEISVASSFGLVPYDREAVQDDSPAAIGPAITNYAVYILDPETAQLLPPGCSGEICVGGPSVSAGYLHNETLTAAKFIPDRISGIEEPGWGRLYRTGDQGRMLNDGSIVYQGRIAGDSQIKLRGIRIELEDVSASLLQSANGVLSNAAVDVSGERESMFLVAFVVFTVGRTPADPARYLRNLLATLPLPQYMRPSVAIPLPGLPRNASGKLDRRALRAIPLPEDFGTDQEDTPLTETEAKVKGIWTSILAEIGVRLQIRKESDFFSVGGNSLLLLKMQRQIKHTLHRDIPLAELFQNTSLESLAQRLDSMGAAETAAAAHNGLDWAAETALSPALLSVQASDCESPELREVVLTGSTGYLGQCLLQHLVASPHVSRVHCIAVRPTGEGLGRQAPAMKSDKVVIHAGDLSAPRLGLSEEAATQIFGACHAIIHCGADVSFMKTYHSLRGPNVQSTHELVRMALPRRVPIHYISTAGVVHLRTADSYDEESVAEYLPPVDGSDGYVASKWASEVYLEAAHRQLHLPVSIHRPSSIIGPGAPPLDIMNNVLAFSRKMRAVPHVPGWHGYLDMVEVDAVAKNIIGTMLLSDWNQQPAVRYFHESGQTVVPVESVREFLQNSEGGGAEFETLPLDKWIAQARGNGMNELVAGFLTLMHETGQGPSMPALKTSRVYGTV
ncbi:putative Hybrid PKS-NRPS biosynthetic cluster [Aspergillus brasiliensis]|uniref:Hybrid PKS-NRPS biosynthetic cluster n=1 Tax=Aspergillus brasiliensis TaxID=319629 RepID=A0A9W5YZ77_9EURO|nr:putative Hybrid PKS-NRPS biosynthetic cluster [Aspergillus brasiliensis]GKZ49292.1 putative Hybrid PKS-NRPS biosynthetic cluster [Aspergillus brasiliensis]